MRSVAYGLFVRTRSRALIGRVAVALAIFVCFALEITSVSRAQTPPGLVAAYGFNEGSGTVVTDVSGNGNDGATTNTTWSTAGKFGAALSFNGTSSWVTVNDSSSLDLTNG